MAVQFVSDFIFLTLAICPKKKKEKNYKNLSNCQTSVTSVHIKLFILHLHQLNLVILQPYYQLCSFHTLLVHADGEC